MAKAETTSSEKKRSPIERAIVWGGILILIGVALMEFRVKSSFNSSFNALNEKLEEESQKDDPFTEKEVEEIVSGYSDYEKQNAIGANELGAARMDRYTYSGLFGAITNGAFGKYDLYVIYSTARTGAKDNIGLAEVLQIDVKPLEVDDSKGIQGSEVQEQLESVGEKFRDGVKEAQAEDESTEEKAADPGEGQEEETQSEEPQQEDAKPAEENEES